MKNEIWKSISGLRISDQVSNFGNVRICYTDRNVEVEQKLNTDGYKVVHLAGKTLLVHRLVATEFIPNPEDKRLVRHKDGDKSNNHADNLEWITAQEYSKEYYLSGKVSGKRIECVTTGSVYLTIASAEIHLGIHRAIIEHSIETGKACCGLLFREIPEDAEIDESKTIFIPVQEAVSRSESVTSIEELRIKILKK